MKSTFLLRSILSTSVALQTVWGQSSTTTQAPNSSIVQQQNTTFNNPVVYEDFADNDVFLGPDEIYYLSASNMHYSPGAPILRSYDLVNWEIIGHSVPTLDFGDARYNLAGENAYRGGTWASTMRYRASNGLWYWIGCVDFWYTYIYTSTSVSGPWKRSAVLPGGTCYYDCGLLIDDDDSMYVVFGGTNVRVAQLSADGLSEAKWQSVFNASDVGKDGIEGNRMYKRNGFYYILDDHPGDITYVWKSSSPWGPYTSKILVNNIKSPVPEAGAPHQGSLIQASTGDWYYMSFTWAYPAGRMPVLAPITWGADDFPIFVPDASGGWGASYPAPLAAHPLSNWTGTDTFRGTSLGPAWEWNHNPNNTGYKVNNGLTLATVTVTDDLYAARNTLTHRIHGEFPVGTIEVDFTNMADGDRVGLAAFRDRSASIGVYRTGNAYTITVVHNMTQDESTWKTTSKGDVMATVPITSTGKKIWLRAELDARASGTKAANFFYSMDGAKFVKLGPSYTMWTNWAYFMGYRFGIFNYATKALGGSVVVSSFTGV